MHPFITGSNAYGTPGPDSDVDLVVFIEDQDDLETLMRYAEPDSDIGKYNDDGVTTLRFGNLNLLCVTDPIAYATWYEATAIMCAAARDGWDGGPAVTRPLTRDAAVLFLTRMRRSAGCVQPRPSVDTARADAGRGLKS